MRLRNLKKSPYNKETETTYYLPGLEKKGGRQLRLPLLKFGSQKRGIPGFALSHSPKEIVKWECFSNTVTILNHLFVWFISLGFIAYQPLAEWTEHSMRLELTLAGLQVKLANLYTTWSVLCLIVFWFEMILFIMYMN